MSVPQTENSTTNKVLRVAVAAGIGVGIAAAAGATGGLALVAAGGVAAFSSIGEEAVMEGLTQVKDSITKHFHHDNQPTQTAEKTVEVAPKHVEHTQEKSSPLSSSLPHLAENHAAIIAAERNNKTSYIGH